MSKREAIRESGAELDRTAIARRLERVRRRTWRLVSVLDWPRLRQQQIPILSPMVWDLGHIGHFEESWLCRQLEDQEPIHQLFEQMFDPQLNPRPSREALPLPEQGTLAEYLGEVRARSLEILRRIQPAAAPALLAGGLVYELVAEHEEQHQETLLQAMQVLQGPPYTPAERRTTPPAEARPAGMVEVPGGPFRMGWGGAGFAYDNELPAHEVEVAAFAIDRAPVSCGEYLEFIAAGGYDKASLWSDAGWAWNRAHGARAPRNWRRDTDGSWRVRHMDRERPPADNRPVAHVCYWEAEAYARFAGKRLATEAEWEKAALWDPASGQTRLWPWGNEPPSAEHANLDQLAFEPAEIGAYPAGASAVGAHQMVGDVWEWTASDFAAYPGFRAFPYPEYSEIFFGDQYKVLRGGSWATRPAVARGSFRNWDYPIRRQIFAGLRCARSL